METSGVISNATVSEVEERNEEDISPVEETKTSNEETTNQEEEVVETEDDILIETFDKLSPDFGELVQPGKGYCGLREFHSQENSDKRVYVIDENEPSLLDDEGTPDSVYQALAMFFVGNAIRCARGDRKKHAMLFHPSQRKIDHEKVRIKVQSILDRWYQQAKAKLAGHNDISYRPVKEYLVKAYNKLVSEGVNTIPFENLEPEILRRISNCSPVLLCNSAENASKRAEEYNTYIMLGGIRFYDARDIPHFDESTPDGVFNAEYDSCLTSIRDIDVGEIVQWIREEQ